MIYLYLSLVLECDLNKENPCLASWYEEHATPAARQYLLKPVVVVVPQVPHIAYQMQIKVSLRLGRFGRMLSLRRQFWIVIQCCRDISLHTFTYIFKHLLPNCTAQNIQPALPRPAAKNIPVVRSKLLP